MNEFYGRVKIGQSAGKSRIALIRKLLISAYHMLKRRGNLRKVLDFLLYRDPETPRILLPTRSIVRAIKRVSP